MWSKYTIKQLFFVVPSTYVAIFVRFFLIDTIELGRYGFYEHFYW